MLGGLGYGHPKNWVLWLSWICHVIFLGLSEFLAPWCGLPWWDDHGSGGFGLKHDTPEIKSTVGCLSQLRAGLDSQVLEEHSTHCRCVVSPIGLVIGDWIGHGGNQSMSDILIFSSNVSLTRLKSKVVFIVATMRWHGKKPIGSMVLVYIC